MAAIWTMMALLGFGVCVFQGKVATLGRYDADDGLSTLLLFQ